MWNKAQNLSSSKKESGPNLTALAEAKSAGKKRKGVTKKLPMKVRSIISDVDELAWQYPQSIDESQGDSLNTGVSTHQSQINEVQPGCDPIPRSMSIVSSQQRIDIHSTKKTGQLSTSKCWNPAS